MNVNKAMEDDDTKELLTRQLRRKQCFEKYEQELIKMSEKKQGKTYRKILFNALKHTAYTVFETDDDEYETCGKFHRGMWVGVDRTFKTKKELDFIVKIATEYGAFDY